MKKKSLTVNAILNGLKTVLSLVFPLITFPYISRILRVEDIGKIDFVKSIISYFVLIAGLGVNTYATREGARCRDDRTKYNRFANEVFFINIISTFISYIALFSIYIYSTKIQEYKMLIFIFSLTIIGNTIGVNWIYSSNEEYMYITIRTIVFQVISIFLMFLLVHSEKDYIKYALITVFSSVGSNILNFINSKKYFVFDKTTKFRYLKVHVKPICIIFASTIASTIYVNSDSTMLGIFSGDYSVGVYSVATKTYIIIQQLAASVILVTLPRLSNYLSCGKNKEYKSTINYIFNILIIILLPLTEGMFLIAHRIILILSGNAYIESIPTLKILSISLIFSVISIFYTNAILLPTKKEKNVMIATIIGAIINVSLNCIVIPLYKQNGAAITTVIAEAVVLLIQINVTRKSIKIQMDCRNFITVIIGCVGIWGLTKGLDMLLNTVLLLESMIIVISDIIFYFIILFFIKNEIIIEGVKKVRSIVGRNKK